MTIYIVDIEPIETRYTSEWFIELPKIIRAAVDVPVVSISGPLDKTPSSTTPGAFLNFAGTNIYKSDQVIQISNMFLNGWVKDGDQFLFTDAWHPGVLQVKYMADLLGVKVKLHGMWHAGSYDKYDFLGRSIKDKRWVEAAEVAMFYAYDHNYFATQFHIEMFCGGLDIDMNSHWFLNDEKKIVRTGWPYDYTKSMLEKYKGIEKEDIVLFPHRLAPEKQVDIFRDLAVAFPNFRFIVCQDEQLTKEEYHILLAKSKIVFSCSLQETLGAACYEGAILDCIPLVPSRLSYTEMYPSENTYPSEWTESFLNYTTYRPELVSRLDFFLANYTTFSKFLPNLVSSLSEEFFTCTTLLDMLGGNL